VAVTVGPEGLWGWWMEQGVEGEVERAWAELLKMLQEE
jgi:hypothetical protein